MRLFHHYKQKPYRLIGEAKHSETLEDVVIYECLYANQTAKLWVRPKAMFYEKVEVDGQMVPRFAEIPIAIETTTEITEAHAQTLAPIIEKCLGECAPDWFRSKLESHNRFYLVMAFIGQTCVGFKLGYGEDQRRFYSWLGGVLSKYRGLGIASALMTNQHDWCRKQGYAIVRTKTQNRYKEMLVLNLKSGFEVRGVHASAKGVEIILEKEL